jgi:hypothetical protein
LPCNPDQTAALPAAPAWWSKKNGKDGIARDPAVGERPEGLRSPQRARHICAELSQAHPDLGIRPVSAEGFSIRLPDKCLAKHPLFG